MVTCPQTQHLKPITQICMCSAKDVFKLPNQHVDVFIIENIFEIQKKAKDPKPEAEERIVIVSKWLIYLNILKVLYWGVKKKRVLCHSRLQYLIFSWLNSNECVGNFIMTYGQIQPMTVIIERIKIFGNMVPVTQWVWNLNLRASIKNVICFR